MDNEKDFNREVLMKNILNQKWPSLSHNVFYVGLFKESQTGLMFNDRMLVVQDRTFTIFYTKCFKPLTLLLQLEKKGNTPIKARLSLLSTTLYKQQNIITIKLLDSQGEPKSWVFKFSTTELADKWMQLYYDIFQKCANKSLKSKQSKSTNFSIEYSSILSNLKYSNPPPEAEEEYSNYTQTKKKINVRKIQESFSH